MLKHIIVPVIIDDHDNTKCSKECKYLEYGGIYCNLTGKRLIINRGRCHQCMEKAK